MDYTKTEFWIAIFAGGSVIAALSAGQQLVWKDPDALEQGVRVKAIIRDFCIGAFLTATLYMFLPESFHSLISAGTSAAQSVTSTLHGGASALDDIEIRTGPARF